MHCMRLINGRLQPLKAANNALATKVQLIAMPVNCFWPLVVSTSAPMRLTMHCGQMVAFLY